MNVLFVHQNFPGQFKHLAPALAARGGHRVVALHVNPVQPMPGVETVSFALAKETAPGIHPWVAEFESKVIRGEAA